MKKPPLVHIYAPLPISKHVRVLECPTCGCKRRFLVRAYEWHDPLVSCSGCGDEWSGGEMLPRPARRGWRDEAKAKIKADIAATFKIGEGKMSEPNEIAPERMRVLLEAMGATEITKPDGRTLYLLLGVGHDFYETAEYCYKYLKNIPAFLLACLRFMESEAVRRVTDIVHLTNTPDNPKGFDVPMIIVSPAGWEDDSEVREFTGPLETRIVLAALRVAELMKESKEGGA